MKVRVYSQAGQNVGIFQFNTNLRKSRRQPSGKSAALSRFSRCVADDDFRESYKSIYNIWFVMQYPTFMTNARIYYVGKK